MKNLIIWAILLGGVGYGGAKAYLHSEVGDAMDMVVMMMSPYADVEYDGVRSTMSGELTIEGIRVNMHDFRDELRIDRMGIDTPSFLTLLEMNDYISMQHESVPDYFGFLVEGVHIPTGADYFTELYEFSLDYRDADDAADPAAACTGKYGFSPVALTALGYTEQVFSMATTVRNTEGTFSFEVAMGIEDMFDLDANLILAGDLQTEVYKGSSYRPRLSALTIDVTDRSINERVQKYCKKMGLSEEQTLIAQMEAFKYVGESYGIEFDEYMLVPYEQFLNGKERITITAKPNSPIAMSQIDLYKASDVPALLNLEARAY